MTREILKDLLPIMQAFVEGKLIQCKDALNDWYDINEIYLGDDQLRKLKLEYRIKPEPKYRPFRTQEECWNEMLKHQPFGYLRNKRNGEIVHITGLNTVHYGELHIDLSINPHSFYTTDCLFEVYTFTDGEPFGIKEE